MAYVKALNSINKFIGASTDTKPTGVPIPSTAYEYDTGDLYHTYDGTNWVLKSSISGVTLKTISVTKALAAAGDYAAEDVMSESATVGTVYTFSNPARAVGGSGIIRQAIVSSETTGLTPRLSLFLFNAAPTSQLNDNLANTAVLNADIAKFVGRIDFYALSDVGGNSEAEAYNLPLDFTCASGVNALYGILVTRDAITGEVATDDMTVKLKIEQI